MRIVPTSLLCTALLLSACASTSTKMVNSTGQVADCSTWGVGWLGAPVALIQAHECEKRHRAMGFVELGVEAVPQPAAAVPVVAPVAAPPVAVNDVYCKVGDRPPVSMSAATCAAVGGVAYVRQ